MSYSDAIGVLDSGLGGISVLRELKRLLPNENYIYFADKDNAPYGSKSDAEIMHLTVKNAEYLCSLGCKALVIACNTATSVAANTLRNTLSVPVIGLEPAIKPAARRYPNGKILVLATPVTLSHEKFQNLLANIGAERFVPFAAPHLVEYVESGMKKREEILRYLKGIFAPYQNIKFDACVLGCTHFPFVKNEISEALCYTPAFFDGAEGTARCLENNLKRLGILNENNFAPYVLWNTNYPNNLQKVLLYNNK